MKSEAIDMLGAARPLPAPLAGSELCLAPLRILLVSETYPPKINGVAMTTERMVQGLRARPLGGRGAPQAAT